MSWHDLALAIGLFAAIVWLLMGAFIVLASGLVPEPGAADRRASMFGGIIALIGFFALCAALVRLPQ